MQHTIYIPYFRCCAHRFRNCSVQINVTGVILPPSWLVLHCMSIRHGLQVGMSAVAVTAVAVK